VSVRLLLDTHVLIWWLEGNERLSRETAAVLRETSSIFVSAVSAWEIAIKSELGKLKLPGPLEEGLDHYGFLQLAVEFRHIMALRDLPLHHRDPFDRMLAAQTKFEGMVLVTADRRFTPYGIPVLWA
jgi:PIN domain nuclease of toxin-antitoxin system